MQSDPETVAVLLWGSIGDWDGHEIVREGEAATPDSHAEYSKTVVVEEPDVDDVLVEHGLCGGQDDA